MFNKKMLLIIGAAAGVFLIIFGAFLTIAPINNFFEIIDKENDAFNDPFISNETKTYNLEPGRYTVYYHSESYNNPGSITILDPDGESVLSESFFIFISSSLELNDREYYKVGSFKAEVEGDYTVSIDNPGVVLILNRWAVVGDIFTIFGYIAIIIAGGLIFSICTILLVIKYHKKEKK